MINVNILNQLKNQLRKKRLITNEYLTDETNENFLYIKDKFFKWQDISKVKVLNTWSWLFNWIANILWDYIWNPKMDLEMPIYLIAKDYVCFGKWLYALWVKDWKEIIEYIPAESHLNIEWDDYIYRSYVKRDYNTWTYEVYILVTSYIANIIENKLYKQATIMWSYTEVGLDSLKETEGLQAQIITKFDKVLFTIQDDNLENEPVSIIDSIKNIVYSIDRKIVMFDTQFLQNVESFILLKWLTLPRALLEQYAEWNKIDFSDLWRVISWDENSSIEFVNNQNELIDKAILYEREQREKISLMTSVPLDFLGWTWTAWAIWEGSRELLHGAFIKTIERLRKLFDKSIMETLEILNIDEVYSWSDVFSKNTKDLIEEIKIAKEIWIISRKTALKRYLDYTNEEIEQELENINNDLSTNNINNENWIWQDRNVSENE